MNTTSGVTRSLNLVCSKKLILAAKNELSEDKLPTDRTLDVIWDAQEDMLQFTGLKDDPSTTKRKILSQAFSVWDPRGLLLPFSMRSKIILQNLNRMKYGWDDELREAE